MRGWIFVGVALLVSAALVAVTFAAVPALSGFAAGLLKAALAVGAFWAFDRFVLRDLDTVAELKAGNVAYGLMLVALALLLAATVAPAQPVSRLAEEAPARPEAGELAVGIAAGYVGTDEKGGANRGPEVEAFQRAVGIPPGSARCAALVGFVLSEAERQAGRRLVPAGAERGGDGLPRPRERPREGRAAGRGAPAGGLARDLAAGSDVAGARRVRAPRR